MASQRFVMLVDPEERAQWGERAKAAGLTTAEFVRRAVAFYDPEEAAALKELEAFMPEYEAALAGMNASLDRINATLNWALDPKRDEEAHAKAAAAWAAVPDEERERMATALFG